MSDCPVSSSVLRPDRIIIQPPYKDLGACIQKKIPVYVVSEDAAERGIPSSELLPGIEAISRSGLAKLFDGFDRVVHW